MLTFTRRASIATAITLGIALNFPLSVPAVSDTASSNTTVLPNPTAAWLKRGDLVRLRSGGPLMTVDSVKDNQADCFWTGLDGQPNAESFPIGVLQKF
jgi:uncharacterized protein YodC (DUF2158 family)